MVFYSAESPTIVNREAFIQLLRAEIPQFAVL